MSTVIGLLIIGFYLAMIVGGAAFVWKRIGHTIFEREDDGS